VSSFLAKGVDAAGMMETILNLGTTRVAESLTALTGNRVRIRQLPKIHSNVPYEVMEIPKNSSSNIDEAKARRGEIRRRATAEDMRILWMCSRPLIRK
jgi:CO dehydrogenase/acetyl-CoA synthase gamma subunit (corrinoid Fe-S protein)